jgi:hypothetical protein
MASDRFQQYPIGLSTRDVFLVTGRSQIHSWLLYLCRQDSQGGRLSSPTSTETFRDSLPWPAGRDFRSRIPDRWPVPISTRIQ